MKTWARIGNVPAVIRTGHFWNETVSAATPAVVVTWTWLRRLHVL